MTPLYGHLFVGWRLGVSWHPREAFKLWFKWMPLRKKPWSCHSKLYNYAFIGNLVQTEKYKQMLLKQKKTLILLSSQETKLIFSRGNLVIYC